MCPWLSPDIQCNRGVHALRGILGNQGKFTKKQSCKTNVFLYISVLISHLMTKHIRQVGFSTYRKCLLENETQNGNMKKNVCFAALFLCNLTLITHNAPLSVISSICHATHPAISLKNDLTSYMKHYVV